MTNLHELNRILEKPCLTEKMIDRFISKKVIKKETSTGEIKGHVKKAEHNLDFIKDAIRLKYLDWAITGCYYACYHAALALISKRGYSSKNHQATLCILIKEFYNKEFTKEDIGLISKFFGYKDILFYAETKNRREDASYSTNVLFDKNETERLRTETVMFVSKAKDILDNEI